MSGFPPVPSEVLNAERERIKKELEIETARSNLLYQRQYQRFIEGQTPDPVVQGQTEERGPADDLTAAVRTTVAKTMLTHGHTSHTYLGGIFHKVRTKNSKTFRLHYSFQLEIN